MASGLTSDEIAAAATVLRDAYEARQPCGPVRDILGSSTDVDAAYAVQELNTDHGLSAGRRMSGRKVGLTSIAVQRQLGVDQPDFGTLFTDMEVLDGVDVDASRLLQPRAEAEVAFVMEDELNRAPHGVTDVTRAIAFVLPAIEIVDSRIAGWDITIVDTIADNASCGAYVLGRHPVPLGALDLRSLPMAMKVNGIVASTGTGSACLGSPLHAACWLADVLCARATPLRPGDIVMTGALGPMVPVHPNDVLHADLRELGTVATRLTEEQS